MPTLFHCANEQAGCQNLTRQPFTVCDECKEAARKLSRTIAVEDTLQYVTKNEGLRRHVKPWWRIR